MSGAAFATCAYCGEAAQGRFCSSCGKPVGEDHGSAPLLREVAGVKAIPIAAIARTAWLACARPALLTTRWRSGQRIGLMSPIAMLSTIAAVSAFVGLLLGLCTGRIHVNDPGNVDVSSLAPFLKARFAQPFLAAQGDPVAFNDKFRKVGGWFAALWPLLLILPGFLALAPWRKIDRNLALILAAVETVFLSIAAAAYTALRIAAPGLMANPLVTTLIWCGVAAHGAIHIRHVASSGWGYAIARPFLAAIYFLPLTYLWMLFVLWVTLLSWPLL